MGVALQSASKIHDWTTGVVITVFITVYVLGLCFFLAVVNTRKKPLDLFERAVLSGASFVWPVALLALLYEFVCISYKK